MNVWKVGEKVIRKMAGIPMPLTITAVTETQVICGAWTFDRETGAEIDEDLGWGPSRSGSYIIPEEQ